VRRSLVAAFALLLAASACSGGPNARTVQAVGPQLVPAWKQVLAECRSAASAVGYPVPCPMRVPAGLRPTPGTGGCRLQIVGAGGQGRCSRAWRGWVVGSSETSDQHLVISASPHPLVDAAKAVNGPGWYPGARVRTLGPVTIARRRMEAVYVPPATNEGSAFADHVVLVWTAGGHTYAVGFHDVAGITATLALDTSLARSIELVGPE
jgi:hypothetical protein